MERADSALVVRSVDADASSVGFAAALPPEPSRTTVVVDASAAGALDALDADILRRLVDRLNGDGPRSAMRDVRLVAARAGGPDSSGAPPLAARLADWLGVGVIAPDGGLIALRGGELFSVGPGAGWLDFRRGSSPQWTGPRYPAPVWQAALPREFQLRRPRALARLRPSAPPVTVTAIPAGLWVRASGSTPLAPADLGYGVPVESARPVVLVGAPGEPTPDVPELADFFASLPPDLRKSAVLASYGQDPDAYAILVQNLADRLRRPIHAYHALPHYAVDGTRRFALFSTTGRPDRLADAPEWVHLPGTAQVRVMPVEEPSALSASRPVGGTAISESTVTGEPEVTGPTAGAPALAGPAIAAPPPGSSIRTADPNPLSFTPADPVMRQGDPNTTLVDPIVSQVAPHTAAVGTVVRQGDPNTTLVDPIVSQVAPNTAAVGTVVRQDDTIVSPAREASVRQHGDPVVRPSTPDRGASTTALVTVDARGFLRPCGPARQSAMARDGIPAPSARPGAYASGTDPAVSGPHPDDRLARPSAALTVSGPAANPLVTGGPAELRTVVSTVVPEARSAAHTVTVRSRAAAPPGQADRPPKVKPVAHTPLSRPSLTEMEPDAGTVPAQPRSVKHVAPPAPLSVPIAGATDESDVSSQAVQPHEPVATPRPSPDPVPDHEPDLVPVPVQPVADRLPAEIDRLWLAHRVSTPEDRQAFRASLGWRYDAAASSVARLLAEQPGLRGAGDADEALMTDLAAVRVFAMGDRAEFVVSVRSGGSESDRPFAVCVAAGLRRLPSFQGVVVCGGPADPEAANAYRLGQELMETAPWTAFDAVDAHLPGATEFLLWSATARRLSGFAESGPHAEVAFLPGTVFRVLAVDPEEASPVRRVLLAEIPAGRSPKQTWFDRVLARLEEAAAVRAALPQPAAVADDVRSVLLPGDPDGVPGQRGGTP
jgi:hypothetical protein